MRRYPFVKRSNTGTCDSFVLIDDAEIDVEVHYRVEPAEPDVNWPGGLDIEQVTDKNGRDIYDDIPSKEMDELRDRVSQDLYDAGDPYDDYADYAYERARDERMGL